MKMRFAAASLIIATLCPASIANANVESSENYLVRAYVPVVCTLTHAVGPVAPVDQGYALGELREYCNAPSGYSVTVSYAPGSLKGAVIEVGDERVTLDGSGNTVVSRAQGPRIRDRAIVAIPGPSGFDTDRLNFQITVV